MTSRCSSSAAEARRIVAQALGTTTTKTTTKAGWCVQQGLEHLAQQGMADVIQQHGVPTFFFLLDTTKDTTSSTTSCRHDDDTTTSTSTTTTTRAPRTALESLCRIVVGQFVSGHAAQAAWKRVLALRTAKEADELLQPAHILRVSNSDDEWHTMLGITRNKAKALHDLATRFDDGRLSEDMFLTTKTDTNTLRKHLLAVRGIGPWSVDMFLLFYLHHSDILPLGDLGVRKGLARHFFDSKTSLCPKKNAVQIERAVGRFQPYRSLVSWYCWKIADAPVSVPTQVAPVEDTESAKGMKQRRRRPRQTDPHPPSTPTSKKARSSGNTRRNVVTP